ncbi:MAG: hypothetical protein ACFE0J_09535 [Elainellaceae cyanobacterium]
MLGNFQQSRLRIEVDASDDMIRKSLLRPEQFRQWLWPQQFSTDLPDELSAGLIFKSWLGPITIQHQVDIAETICLRLLMSEGIDGFHEWHWGDGWIQSCLEGVSVLPLNLGQTVSLMRLRQFLEQPSAQ